MTEPTDINAQSLLEHRAFVRGLARALVSDPSQVDDLEQETWLAAMARPPRAADSVLAWLKSALHRIASKSRRGDERRDRRERAAAPNEATEAADQIVLRLSAQREVVDAVLRLTRPEQIVVVLRYYEGLGTQAIATELGLPLSTVRSRLRRGLELLRRELLDARGSRSPSLRHGLFLLAGWRPAAAVVSGSTAGASLIGVGVMSLKTTNVCVALVASVVLLTATAWWIVRESQGEGAARSEASASASELVAAANRDAAPAVPALDPDRSEVPGAVEGGDDAQSLAAAGEVEKLPAGTLCVNVVDAVSGEKVKGVQARLLSERRYAEAMFAGGWQAPLSPGSWSGSLRAQGYEAMPLESFSIQSQKTTDLGTLAMRRGTGSIEGRVDVLALDAQQPLRAELRGVGRRGCSACTAKTQEQEADEMEIFPDQAISFKMTVGSAVRALSGEASEVFEIAGSPSTCKVCGFSGSLTQVTFDAAAGFKFGNLAGGKYSLQILRPDGHRLGKRLKIELSPLQNMWVTVDATHKTDVDFELETPSAQPFTGTIMKNGEWRQVARTATYELTRDGEPYATATVSLEPPPPPREHDASSYHEVAGRAMTLEIEPQIFAMLGSLHEAEREAADRLDRARAAEDTLWPGEEAPNGGATPLEAIVLGAGRHRLLGLAPESLTLRVTAGYFASDPIPLELESFDGRPIKVVMHTTPHCDKDEEPKGPSCASCHKEGVPGG